MIEYVEEGGWLISKGERGVNWFLHRNSTIFFPEFMDLSNFWKNLKNGYVMLRCITSLWRSHHLDDDFGF